MSLHENVAEIVGAIYDAAIAPERWVEALDGMAAVFAATHGVCLSMEHCDLPPALSQYWVSRSIEREAVEYYQARLALTQEHQSYYRLFPLFPLIEPFRRTDFLSDADFTAAESYEMWNRPMDLYYTLTSKVFAADADVAMLNVGRKRKSGDFGRDDVALMAVLAPHVHRSVQMQRRFALAEAEHACLALLPWAIVLVDAAGALLSCNAAGDALLRSGDGLSLRRGRLVAAAPRETGALLAAIRQAGVAADGAAQPPAALALPRPSRKRPLEVLVAPLRRPPARPAPAVALFVSDPERVAEPVADVLRRLYGLSPAEAALAAALADGSGLGEAAARLGIALSTAKTQLQAVFAKTDTRRQAQLVHLLLTGPATLQVPR